MKLIDLMSPEVRVWFVRIVVTSLSAVRVEVGLKNSIVLVEKIIPRTSWFNVVSAKTGFIHSVLESRRTMLSKVSSCIFVRNVSMVIIRR